MKHFSEGGEGVTNFDFADRPIYEAAIKEHGDSDLYISTESMGGRKWLLCLCRRSRTGDLSSFWRIFDRIKSETRRPYIAA